MIKVCNCCQRVYRCEEDFFVDTYYWRFDEMKNLYFNCGCDSTLILVKGTYDWYRPERSLHKEAANVFNKLSLGDLIPKIPTGIARIRKKLATPDVEISEVGLALKSEPMILADVLKTASILAGRHEEPFTSIEHALVYAGLKTINDIVITASLRQIGFKTKIFSSDDFWRPSFLTGALAELIAGDKNICRFYGAEIYLAGCLANIGKVIYSSCLPDLADKIAQESVSKQISWQASEIALGMPSHTTLGEIAAAFWSLPQSVLHATTYHHAHQSDSLKSRGSKKQREFVSLITFANQLKNRILNRPADLDLDLLRETGSMLDFSISDVEVLSKKYAYLADQVI